MKEKMIIAEIIVGLYKESSHQDIWYKTTVYIEAANQEKYHLDRVELYHKQKQKYTKD